MPQCQVESAIEQGLRSQAPSAPAMLGFCVAAGTLPLPALQLLLNAALYDPGAQRAQRAEAIRCLAQSIWIAAPADRLQWAQRICSAVQVRGCRGGGKKDERKGWARYSQGRYPPPFYLAGRSVPGRVQTRHASECAPLQHRRALAAGLGAQRRGL